MLEKRQMTNIGEGLEKIGSLHTVSVNVDQYNQIERSMEVLLKNYEKKYHKVQEFQMSVGSQREWSHCINCSFIRYSPDREWTWVIIWRVYKEHMVYTHNTMLTNTWMNLEGIMHSHRSQTQKDKYPLSPVTCSFKRLNL